MEASRGIAISTVEGVDLHVGVIGVYEQGKGLRRSAKLQFNRVIGLSVRYIIVVLQSKGGCSCLGVDLQGEKGQKQHINGRKARMGLVVGKVGGLIGQVTIISRQMAYFSVKYVLFLRKR